MQKPQGLARRWRGQQGSFLSGQVATKSPDLRALAGPGVWGHQCASASVQRIMAQAASQGHGRLQEDLSSAEHRNEFVEACSSDCRKNAHLSESRARAPSSRPPPPPSLSMDYRVRSSSTVLLLPSSSLRTESALALSVGQALSSRYLALRVWR